MWQPSPACSCETAVIDTIKQSDMQLCMPRCIMSCRHAAGSDLYGVNESFSFALLDCFGIDKCPTLGLICFSDLQTHTQRQLWVVRCTEMRS